jgi:uridine kinase
MPHEPVVARLAARCLAMPKRPLLVAIDGQCCAGKTRLADELAAALRDAGFAGAVLRPSIDGFHHPAAHRHRQGVDSWRGYYEDAFDHGLARRVLLAPLRDGPWPASCRLVAHDVRAEVAVDEVIEVHRDTILLFDGVFLFRPELDDAWDLRVLVDVPDELAIRRARERDGPFMGGADTAEHRYRARYVPAWHHYVAQCAPRVRADLVVDNRQPDARRLG